MKNNIVIVDGHNYLYRAYYGIPQVATLPSGFKINAYYGFMAFLRKLVKTYTTEKLLVVFDSEEGISEKKLSNPEYKGNRNYEDTQIFEQLKVIKQVLDYCGIQYLEEEKCEADDVIATLAKKYSQRSFTSFIASNDSDFIQCINDNIVLLKTVKGKYIEYTQDFVLDTLGIPSTAYLDLISLKGDSSDNIRGVDGIGWKTAIKIIQEFGVVENIASRTIPPHNLIRAINLIKANYEKVLRNKEFLKIHDNIKIDLNMEVFNKSLLLSKSSNDILKDIGLYE